MDIYLRQIEWARLRAATYVLIALLAFQLTVLAAPNASLAKAGQAAMPVVTSVGASTQTKELATTLADYLSRISGAKFQAVTGDGRSGIVVGTMADFPALGLAKEFDEADPARREEYVLRSHERGVYLIGATQTAVSNAVWDFLYRLGYRQFFPGRHWEVVPSTPNLSIAIDTKEKPSFQSRGIWYGFGDWPDGRVDQNNWRARNRMAGGPPINSGHVWDSIYKAHKAEFDAHPEYLVSEKPVKFCVSNPGLRKLVVDWALQYFKDYPTRESISLEPSDGGGWEGTNGNCPDAQVYKNITDRVVTLANEVAEALNRQYPGKYVGIYAYYKHSPPPTIKVHPNVVVGVATAYIQGNYTFDQLAKGWRDQGATLGVREYYSVAIGHKDKPGGANASNVAATAASVKKQYALGARFISAESSDSWGPAGLGYYTATRLFSDVKESPEAIREDFLEKAFGPAKEPMREFYNLIDGVNRPLFAPNLLGRMYRQLDAARKLTDDPGIRGRLDDLTLWTRYSEMLKTVLDTPKNAANSDAALAFAYRIRSTHMVSSLALWRDTRNGFVALSGDSAWNVPEGKNTLKSSAPFSDGEIAGFIRDGIANNPIVTFKPVQFSDNLKPAAPLKLPAVPSGKAGYTRGEQTYYVWFDQPGTLSLSVTGGQIAANGVATLRLFEGALRKHSEAPPLDENGEVPVPGETAEEPLAVTTAPNDRAPYDVEIKAPRAGLYRITIKEGGRGTGIEWPQGAKVTVPSSDEMRTLLRGGKWSMYFYVPKGTSVVGGYADGWGRVLDGSGTLMQNIKPGYFNVPVNPGQDGKLWKFEDSTGRRILMTVPPYLARSVEELLLPEEVIKADAGKP